MDKEFIIGQACRIAEEARNGTSDIASGVLAEATEFLRIYAGEQSRFMLTWQL
ncbi:hypothetical protein [Dethiobacter alkaliphilus]|uniref:hypothetical protein n=1 Tax=Dethiobacter alkaliphilus TaxID=427926 RepID=UPI0022280472|nr:hypothetical protein [Dethiobacter alkaliphilus]MCW3491545.1 hypothetical protein [Dethiobacter alkaliphilus]